VTYGAIARNGKLLPLFLHQDSSKYQTESIQPLWETEVTFFTVENKLIQLLFLFMEGNKLKGEKEPLCDPSWFSGNGVTWPESQKGEGKFFQTQFSSVF
jgi:hypothetical protein